MTTETDRQGLASHTPGPWAAERMPHGWHIGPQPAGTCTIHDNTDGSKREEHEANAHLIAAAPALLEALERAAEVVHKSVPVGRIIRAAIASARPE